MPTNDENEVIICRCEEVTRKEVLDAIDEGCESVIWVKRKTRAGMGLCQGRTCGHLVARLIEQETEQQSADIKLDTQRPPLRPVPLDIVEETGEE
jgi:NAD(P)H-nitrite reductase large subunit